jgi:hypothetical protein
MGAIRVVVHLADLGDGPGVEESTGREDLPLALVVGGAGSSFASERFG